jgi:hypothetical protein
VWVWHAECDFYIKNMTLTRMSMFWNAEMWFEYTTNVIHSSDDTTHLDFVLKKINNSCLILMRWARICFLRSGFWDILKWIFQNALIATENALIEWLRKETTRFFFDKQKLRGFFNCKSSFHNFFSNLFSFSAVCLKSPFSKNTVILCSKKTP